MERPLYRRGDVVRWQQEELRPGGVIDLDALYGSGGRIEPEPEPILKKLKRKLGIKSVKTGVVWVVDVGGAWGLHEHSYDILEPFEPFDYKHVPQSSVIGPVENEAERRRVLAAYDAVIEESHRLAEEMRKSRGKSLGDEGKDI